MSIFPAALTGLKVEAVDYRELYPAWRNRVPFGLLLLSFRSLSTMHTKDILSAAEGQLRAQSSAVGMVRTACRLKATGVMYSWCS